MIKKYSNKLNYKESLYKLNNDLNKYDILSLLLINNTIPINLIEKDDNIIVYKKSPKLFFKLVKEYIKNENNIGIIFNNTNLIWITKNMDIYIYGKNNDNLNNYIKKIFAIEFINIIEDSDFNSENYNLIFLIFKTLDFSDEEIKKIINKEFNELKNILYISLANKYNEIINI